MTTSTGSPEPQRKGEKKAAPEPEEPEEEVIIRCVCGAREQDSDSGSEPWIGCDACGAWQHNICMGMSQYSEDLPEEYFCELCRPGNHKGLIASMAKGGKKPLWQERRRIYEEEEKTRKKGNARRKGQAKKKAEPRIHQSSRRSPKRSRIEERGVWLSW
ncbi:hypothetical protein B0H66DRAFT_593362 [Apodospora peruviana]|uniref:Zinc finger PHD-type domain-containing protein n=1 Tax=Apodospora peruviana TaxID=516989 RepID=A0AAE0M1J8_9PEZI|nr:hypothetical protein B0H66DRAFT_593362 [Apodospora peruviana]